MSADNDPRSMGAATRKDADGAGPGTSGPAHGPLDHFSKLGRRRAFYTDPDALLFRRRR